MHHGPEINCHRHGHSVLSRTNECAGRGSVVGYVRWRTDAVHLRCHHRPVAANQCVVESGANMRALLILSIMIAGMSLPVRAHADISIGINFSAYPDLVPLPGYPVYYAPQVDANLFFYDGMYWVYANDGWYSSSWYNGPWNYVQPSFVPYYVLRVPVRYYRRPPVFFRGWNRADAPRWGEHWGGGWEQNHRNWDHWDHARPPARAPLPTYQRQYGGNRYPDAAAQRQLHERNYRFKPHEAVDRRNMGAAPHGRTPPQANRPGNAPQAMRRAPIVRPQPTAPRPQQHGQPQQRQQQQQLQQRQQQQHQRAPNGGHPTPQRPVQQRAQMQRPGPANQHGPQQGRPANNRAKGDNQRPNPGGPPGHGG